MAYQELIKNFNRIRAYMREFYVYGFKSREEYTGKSARSYDDERRRIESWLGDYMHFRQTPEGKQVFLSIDSRVTRHNPLYQAFGAKSFTDGDITLHFILLDILADAPDGLTLGEIMDRMDPYFADFSEFRVFDQSTVRKKLKEYCEEGLLAGEKRGRQVVYSRTDCGVTIDRDLLDFFSEAAPCGVVGAYLLDRQLVHTGHFAFKHHYITGALDSEVICSLFEAMGEHREVTLETVSQRAKRPNRQQVIPLQIRISVQSGRQYLMAFSYRTRRILPIRTDRIVSVQPGAVASAFSQRRQQLREMERHLWGVSTQGRSGKRMEHVDFTVIYGADEMFIPKRLEREKRCGSVEQLDSRTLRFSAEVYDARELIPWIRTFICRITSFHCSDPGVEAEFWQDIARMNQMYGVEETKA